MGRFEQHKVDVDIIRPSDSVEARESLRMLFGNPGQVHVEGDQADVMVEDVLCRHLPNGNTDYHRVVDVTTFPGGRLANILLTVERCAPPRLPETSPGGYDLDETWMRRDLPILRAILHLNELDPDAPETTPDAIASLSSYDIGVVQTALRALQSDDLVSGVRTLASGDAYIVGGVTGEGRRRAGAWPSPELAAERMVRALEALAEDHSRPADQRSAARRILDAIGEAGTQVGTAVLTNVLTRTLGGG